MNSPRLSEFSDLQLMWMRNKSLNEITDINLYVEAVEKYGMSDVVGDEVEQRKRLKSELEQIFIKVCDTLDERKVMSN